MSQPTAADGSYEGGIMSVLGSDQASVFNVRCSQRLFFPYCFPDEILTIIFRYVLVFPEKVHISNDIDDADISNVGDHLDRCKIGYHTYDHTTTGNLIRSRRTHYRCHEFYSKKIHDIIPNPSVIGLLQVNKRINRIATGIFFSENKFVFVDLSDVVDKAISIGKVRSGYIRDISFQFTSSGATGKYYHLIRVLPNLTNLSLYLDVRRRDVHKNRAGNLKTCKGMKEMVHALSGLAEVNLNGVDWTEADPELPGDTSRHVSVNHRRAAGPWIREKLMRPKEVFLPAKKAISIRPEDPQYPPTIFKRKYAALLEDAARASSE